MNIITTNKSWNDILSVGSVKTITDLLNAYAQKKQLPVTDKNQSTSCCLLFYGGDKENRTDAAALAGTQTNQQVFQVNVSQIVSKYIGETEKNLQIIFDEAERNNAILFFDEADALFGKRSEVKDSHDRYANIEINYLLHEVTTHAITVIFSADSKEQIPSFFSNHLHPIQFS